MSKNVLINVGWLVSVWAFLAAFILYLARSHRRKPSLKPRPHKD
jgi:hypothetical protein